MNEIILDMAFLELDFFFYNPAVLQDNKYGSINTPERYTKKSTMKNQKENEKIINFVPLKKLHNL